MRVFLTRRTMFSLSSASPSIMMLRMLLKRCYNFVEQLRGNSTGYRGLHLGVVSAFCRYYRVTASATSPVRTTYSRHTFVLLVPSIFPRRPRKGLFKLRLFFFITRDLHRHLAATSVTFLPEDKASPGIIRSKWLVGPLYILKIKNIRFEAATTVVLPRRC